MTVFMLCEKNVNIHFEWFHCMHAHIHFSQYKSSIQVHVVHEYQYDLKIEKYWNFILKNFIAIILREQTLPVMIILCNVFQTLPQRKVSISDYTP